MKLKTIVASLVALGLSGSVLTAQAMMLDTSYQMDQHQWLDEYRCLFSKPSPHFLDG